MTVSRGFGGAVNTVWRIGRVASITRDSNRRLVGVVVDRFNAKTEVILDTPKAKGLALRVGDTVFIDRSTGSWTVAAVQDEGVVLNRTFTPAAGLLVQWPFRGGTVHEGDRITASAQGVTTGNISFTLTVGDDPVALPSVALGATASHWTLGAVLLPNGSQTGVQVVLEHGTTWAAATRRQHITTLTTDWAKPQTLLLESSSTSADVATLAHLPGQRG